MRYRRGWNSNAVERTGVAQIRRFVRFNLGEGLQKKSVDFAAEVAAQTAAKDPKPAAAEAPKVEEAPKVDEAPKVRVIRASVTIWSLCT